MTPFTVIPRVACLCLGGREGPRRLAASGIRKVREWLTPNPIRISINTPLIDAQKMMTDHGIRHLPVMNENRPVGIITLRTCAAPSLRTSRVSASGNSTTSSVV